MKGTFICTAFLMLLFSNIALCQKREAEFFLTINNNFLLPGNSSKHPYPILFYNSKTSPKVQVGGFGIGFAALLPGTGNIQWKAAGNFSRHAFWDTPFEFTSNSGYPIGSKSLLTVEYDGAAYFTGNYYITPKLMAGIGLGAQVFLLSTTHLEGVQAIENRYYRPVTPVVPLEVCYKTPKVFYSIRYEHGLIDRLKGNLGKYNKDQFSLLTFEVGIKLN